MHTLLESKWKCNKCNRLLSFAPVHSLCLSAGCSTAFLKQLMKQSERGAASETHKLIAGKEDGNKSSRKANVENAVLVYV